MTNDTPPKACLADFGFTTIALDPQNPISSISELEGGTKSFMAPELLAPSRYGLKSAVPTHEGDIYAFGLVVLQVFMLYCRHLPVFLDVPSGPDGRATISSYQSPGALVPRLARCSPGETYGCRGHRDLRLLVEAHSKLLGRRENAKTTDSGGRCSD